MTSTKLLVVISALLFIVFFFNVLLGAFAQANFLSDVGEALMLFITVLVFVAAMLASEKKAKH